MHHVALEFGLTNREYLMKQQWLMHDINGEKDENYLIEKGYIYVTVPSWGWAVLCDENGLAIQWHELEEATV